MARPPALFLLLVLTIPAALAQVDLTATDPRGDGRVMPLHEEPGLGDREDATDLLSVRLAEEPDLLRIELEGRTSDVPVFNTGNWQFTQVHFTIGEARYLIHEPGIQQGEGAFGSTRRRRATRPGTSPPSTRPPAATGRTAGSASPATS